MQRVKNHGTNHSGGVSGCESARSSHYGESLNNLSA